MSKFYASVGLISMLLVQTPLFAADKATDAADTTKAAAPSTPAAGKKGGGGGKHGQMAPMRAVLGLSSLTDKQKEQLNAIYEGNKAQFKDLHKQIHDLEVSEWTKVKPILTDDQVAELQKSRQDWKGHHHNGGGGGAKAGASASSKDAPAATDAPTDSSK